MLRSSFAVLQTKHFFRILSAITFHACTASSCECGYARLTCTTCLLCVAARQGARAKVPETVNRCLEQCPCVAIPLRIAGPFSRLRTLRTRHRFGGNLSERTLRLFCLPTVQERRQHTRTSRDCIIYTAFFVVSLYSSTLHNSVCSFENALNVVQPKLVSLPALIYRGGIVENIVISLSRSLSLSLYGPSAYSA